MKKITVFLIYALLIINTILPASAAGISVKLSPSDTTVKVGNTFTVSVTVNGAPAVKSGSIAISYSNKLQLVSGTWKLSGTTLASFDISKEKGAFAFSTDSDANGKIFELTFKAKEISTETQTVQATIEYRNGSNTVGNINTSTTVKIVCAAHTYSSWVKVDANNHKRTCSVCGAVETKGHNWNVGSAVKTATCVETGVMAYTCKDCGTAKTTSTAKTAHIFGEWKIDKEATCTEKGAKSHICTVCGNIEKAEIKALGHDLTNTKIVKQATLQETGLKKITCKRCGKTIEEVIPKLSKKTAESSKSIEASKPVKKTELYTSEDMPTDTPIDHTPASNPITETTVPLWLTIIIAFSTALISFIITKLLSQKR